MAGRSNGAFLPLLPAAPLPDSGWTVQVIAHYRFEDYARGRTVTPLAQLARPIAAAWSPGLSDVGAGTITLRLDDPVFSYPLPDGRDPTCLYTYANLWVLFEDGQWRGEFLGEKVDFPKVSASGPAGRTVTISGAGGAQTLAWAKVMSPYYPATNPKDKIGVYRYVNMPVMASWLNLLFEAQRRSSIPWVHCRFSAVKDTGGKIWEDTPHPKPKNTATVVLGDVNFTTDSFILTPAGQTQVAKIAGKIAKVSYPQVSIVGHADSRGTLAHNFQLGLDRANAVSDALQALRPEIQVTTSSKGETQPIASNRTAAGQAKNRRVVVTYTSAPAYVDTVFTPQRGTTLLDLLKQLTSGQTTADTRGPIHCEWIMRKGFELQVRSMIGVDRSKQVVYHEGSTWLQSEQVSYDRSNIANLIAVQNEMAVYKTAFDAASIDRWHQRESYTLLQGSYSAQVQGQIARRQCDAYAQESANIIVTVIAGEGRTPFRDFGIGDWIGVSRLVPGAPSVIDRQRVVAISVAIDATGTPTYELTVSTARQTRLTWLQTAVDALINRHPGLRGYTQDDEPTGGLPGDLWTPTYKAN